VLQCVANVLQMCRSVLHCVKVHGSTDDMQYDTYVTHQCLANVLQCAANVLQCVANVLQCVANVLKCPAQPSSVCIVACGKTHLSKETCINQN